MRIGFEAKRATHNFRGLGNYSRGIIEGLINYQPNEELILYTPPVEDQRGIDWLNSLPASVLIKGPNKLIEKQLSSLWRSFLLASNLKKDRLDIFHGLSHEIPFGLSNDMPFKKIVTMHDLIFLRYPEFFPLIDRLVYAQKFKYACKNSDMVIAICEQTKDDLVKYLGVAEKKIVVHYQSCAPSFYQLLEQEKLIKIREKYKLPKAFILNVGAFEERKNQLNLLEAYAVICNKIEEDLVFVGQGKGYKEKIEARVLELKLNHRVLFLSSVRFDELPALYQSASVFCFPSLFEGFGIPIVEALFSKIPVITSSGSCFPESAGPDSYFIDPLSVSSIGNGLLKVLDNKKLQNEMSEKGLKFVQRFHQEETTKKLMELYRCN
jgi:glycosyltransferase involved in cell wall biosynthesis